MQVCFASIMAISAQSFDSERTPVTSYIDVLKCVGEFRTTFRTIPAFVAQWIEHRFPKPQVASSILAEGAGNALILLGFGLI